MYLNLNKGRCVRGVVIIIIMLYKKKLDYNTIKHNINIPICFIMYSVCDCAYYNYMCITYIFF